MHESADITAYKLVPEGTYLQIFIPGKNLMEPIIEKHMNSCSIWLDDGRHISSDQRRKIYATVNDISAYSGNVPEVEKEWLKYLHINRTGCGYFSLSDCSMDTAREFINTILDYALEQGIPLLDFALNRTDDIGPYLYVCLKLRNCAICGGEGVIRHVERIDMGNGLSKDDDWTLRKI